MRIFCPFCRSAPRKHHSEFRPPSGIAAASSKIMPVGIGAMRALSRTHMNSAYAPNLNPVLPKTRSPTRNAVTAAPTSATSPANSLPRILCRGARNPETPRLISETARPLRRLASLVAQSPRVTDTARTLTSTSSSSRGAGFSTSSIRNTSGGPYLSYTTALMSPIFSGPARLDWAHRDRPHRAGWLRDDLRSRPRLGVGSHAPLPEGQEARHVGSAGPRLLIRRRRLGRLRQHRARFPAPHPRAVPGG